MKVFTYIDGFNLYHSIKDLNSKLEYLKWLNVSQLSQMFLSRNDNNQVKFFTAYPTWKYSAHQKHKDYVRILQDLGVHVILGNFKTKEVYCHNCKNIIKKHEEKQTDVNIAIHIIRDIYEKKPDIIHLISGDTDLIPPLQAAKEMGIKIYVTIPPNRKANQYNNIADKVSHVKLKHLEKCFIGRTYTICGVTLQCPYTTP